MTPVGDEAASAVGLPAIHQVLQRWIDTTPDRTAVRDGPGSLTYGELSERADRYAGQLAALGVRAGDVVPLRLPKSADLIAVLLALLRVGAAYSLIGLDWPPARVNSVLKLLDPPILVGEHPDRRPTDRCPTWWPAAHTRAIPYARAEVTGHDPYAVFFTSGTTGDPKGAVCPHAGIVRLLRRGAASPFRVRTAAAQSLALPWDFSALEIWATLLSGATLVLVHDRYLTGARLRSLIEVDRIDTLMLATAIFTTLVEECPDAFRGLTKLIVGGEALQPRHCVSLLTRFPDLQLINAYGPVEAGVFSTTHQVELADARSGSIPIGRPLPDTQLLVDPPAGPHPGELLIGGPGIAHGYLDDPELTAARFVTRDVGGRPATMYRTGDLVHTDASARLHFRGRLDAQVKVSGRRVDPAEVEATLCSIDGVRAGAVVAHRRRAGHELALAAFVVVEPEVTAAEVERELSDRLAAFQRPATLAVLTALPLSSNGKVDRMALTELALLAPSGPVEHVRPDGSDQLAEVRAVLAELGIQTTRLTDAAPFRALGITSLDFARIAGRLGRRLELSIPLSAVYEHDSVRALANYLTELQSPAAPLARARRADLTPAQSYFLADHLRDPASADQNCLFAWQLPGSVELAALRAAFDLLHARHEALRSRYEFRRGGRITPLALPPPTLITARAPSAATATTMLKKLGQRRFHPRQGEVWFPFVMSIDAPAPATIFGLCAHHVAIDGGSAQAVAADIEDCLRQRQAGIEPGLPPAQPVGLAVQDRQQRLAQVDLDAQARFWTDYRHDLPALELPAGEPNAPADVVSRMARLTPAERDRLERAARRLQVSPFGLYLSAYAEAMGRVTGRTELAVLTAVDQRAEHAFRRSVSCEIALLCLRVPAPAHVDASALRAISERLAGPFAAADTFFGQVDTPGAVIARRDQLQNMLILQDNLDSEIRLGRGTATTVTGLYPGLPVDLLTEVVPRVRGGAELWVHVRSSAVAPTFAAQLLAAMHHTLKRMGTDL